jgi:tyrosine-protein kinase Etk/Wzc
MKDPVKPTLDEEIYLEGDKRPLDYLIFLAKYSRSILWVSAAATILTYLILFILPNKYTAQACIMPPQENISMASTVLSNIGIVNSPTNTGQLGGLKSLIAMRTPSDIFAAMMESDGIYDRIIRRFNLSEVFKENILENLRKKLKKIAKIKASREGLIYIEVTDENPKQAAELANGFPEELDNLMVNISQTEAKNYVIFLEQERSKASINLTKAEEALRGFSEKSSVLQIDAQTKGMIEYIANLRANIDAKEVQMLILQKQATQRNYDTVRLETEIKGLKEKLRAAESQAECVGDVCIATSKVPALGLKYLRLYREAKYRETVYELYKKLLELAYIDAARNVGTIQYVHRATVPEKRSNKRASPSIIVGFVTFFLMIGISSVREYSEKVKANEEEAQQWAILQGYLQPYQQFLAKTKNFFKRKNRRGNLNY